MEIHNNNSSNNYNYNHMSNNNNWRIKKAENFNADGSRPRSFNSRKSSFGRQPSSWEKKFCATAGVPWHKVVETQKYMCQDDKVLKWNDSAVKEAFMDAKQRFWAAMHGQPCDIKLPDPDIFIDKIDWDAIVDPVLLSDLENREFNGSYETEKQDGGVIGIPVIPEQYLLTPTGWGDAEEVNPQTKNNCELGGGNGWHQCDVNNESKGHKGWSSGWRDPYDDYVYVTENRAGGRDNRDNGSTWHGYNKKWDHGLNKNCDNRGYNTSRYKISRFHHNVNSQSIADDDKHNRGNFAHERPFTKWRPVYRKW